jgi:hypothetical protein
MTIRERYKNADEDIQKIWRMSIMRNFSLLQVYEWFTILENPRPSIKIGDQIEDDGKPVENIHFEDILKAVHSLSPAHIKHDLVLDLFIDWFLDLESDRFEESNEDSFSNFLDFGYMARAWNYYVTNKAITERR